MAYKPREVDLINFETGERIKTNSISEFCRMAGLIGSDKYHITPILDGERLHHKNWCLPETLKNETIIVDLHGNEYTLIKLLKIKKEFSLTFSSLMKLINGEIDIYKGLHIKGSDIQFRIPQHFEYEFSNGETNLKSRNVAALGRMFGRPPHNFYKHIHGKTSEAYGYRLTRVRLLEPKNKIHKH